MKEFAPRSKIPFLFSISNYEFFRKYRNMLRIFVQHTIRKGYDLKKFTAECARLNRCFFARQEGLVWQKVQIRDDTGITLPVVEPRIIRSRSRMRNIRWAFYQWNWLDVCIIWSANRRSFPPSSCCIVRGPVPCRKHARQRCSLPFYASA